VHRFGQRRPYRRKRLANTFERLNTAIMFSVVAIEKRDERARVNENVCHGQVGRVRL
jgi:hypothetical protein